MANQALYRKWRPQTWEDVVHQEQVTRVLKSAIRNGRVGHAYLFSGPRGTGKTTVARILARAVNCLDEDLAKRPCDHCANCESVNRGQFMDLIEIDAASNTSVDDIRELRDKINFAPGVGRMKVYIIDEVHMLSTAAFNALLKTLEEPPAHAMFILATTEIHKIPATVLSRCQHLEFRRIPVPEIADRLKKICEKEGFQADDNALTLIARQSTGAMRDAISMLDQMASSGEPISLKTVQDILGIATNQSVIDLTEAIIQKNNAAGLGAIQTALDAGTDPRQFARQMVEYLRQMLILKMGINEQLDVASDIREKMAGQARSVTTEKLVSVIRIFNQAAVDNRIDWHPGLNLELAFAESCEDKAPGGETIKVIEKQIIRETVPAAGSAIPVKNVEAPEVNQDFTPSKIFIRSNCIPDPSVTLQDIRDIWPNVLSKMREHDPVIAATIQQAKLMEVNKGVLMIGFPGTVIRKKIEENGKASLWTSAAIKNVLGKDVGVRYTSLQDRSTTNTSHSEAVEAALELGGKLVVNQ